MDKRRNYICVLDTETANCQDETGVNPSSALVYDLGFAIIDKHYNIYEKRSFVIKDIFNRYPEAIESAYYFDKLPQYYTDIENGKRMYVDFYTARQCLLELMEDYNCRIVAAHNARFDYTALNATQRILTNSKYRYFFPFDVEIWDTMKMANDTICKQTMYKDFCQKHGYLLKNGSVRKTAEILYQYLTSNPNFSESHTGLEDVLIESYILHRCYVTKKAMRKKLFEKNFENPLTTELQCDIMYNVKRNSNIYYEKEV